MKQDLTGKIAVVTGAGGGIGRATAVRLAQEKMKIVLFGGNNLGKLDETRRLVEQQTECLAVPGNLTDLRMMDAMFDVPSQKVKSFVVTLDYAKKQLGKAHLQKLAS